ncbi:MAG: hypothetical protein HY885_12015 [Deltaproteobacteria bacterium]|nr:hypothetical protein [Deltaproteobacteria bacterium]
MYFDSKITYRGGAIVLFILLGGGLVASQPRNFVEDPVNERCVLCHVDTYNLSLKSHYQHLPAFERQCAACHLREGTRNLAPGSRPGTTRITGTLVSQKPHWAKQFIHPGAKDKTVEHMIDLGNLAPAKQYRFRIVLSETAERAGRETMASSWFGLAPREMTAAGKDKSITCVAGSSSFADEMVASPGISCPAGSRIFVSWQTKRPVFAWLELQEMDGSGPGQLAGAADAGVQVQSVEALTTEELHDLRRTPEELTIDVCYTCHPEANLGASHPVRLYANGSDTKIPKELPTIEGMMTCVTCHDPHGSAGKQLIREEIKTKLCVACHFKFKRRSQSTIFD